MRRQRKDEYVAYHEAGHAVMAWLLNARVRRATIIPDLDSAGHILKGKLGRDTRFGIEQADRFHPSRRSW
jgi:ATP-dependent Zn protease